MMIDGQEVTWWMSEEDVQEVIVEMKFAFTKRVKKIRLVFKYTIKAFVIDGQYKNDEFVKIHEETDAKGIKTFEWDMDDKEFKALKLTLLESTYMNPDSGKPQYGIEMFEAYSFMKTVGIEECND
jgi:hypothetical protein